MLHPVKYQVGSLTPFRLQASNGNATGFHQYRLPRRTSKIRTNLVPLGNRLSKRRIVVEEFVEHQHGRR